MCRPTVFCKATITNTARDQPSESCWRYVYIYRAGSNSIANLHVSVFFHPKQIALHSLYIYITLFKPHWFDFSVVDFVSVFQEELYVSSSSPQRNSWRPTKPGRCDWARERNIRLCLQPTHSGIPDISEPDLVSRTRTTCEGGLWLSGSDAARARFC